MPAGATDFRCYRAGDGPRIADAWTRAMPSDGITPARLRNLILLDRNFDPNGLIVAESDGDIVGAIYGVRRLVAEQGADLESDRGWILFFFVSPSSRGQGIGRELLTRTMDWLGGHGATEAVFSSYTPNYVLPGLDQARYPAASTLMASAGFSTLEKADAMSLSLRGYALPAAERTHADDLRAQGWYLGTLRDDQIVPLIALAGDSFNADWARVLREGIVTGMPLERIIVAQDPSGSIIGWAMHGTYEGVIDRFGPFGVLPQSRGTGLGRLLLHLTLERMVSLGAQTAWFLWADEGSAASNLYQKTGFEITRTFSILSAPIDGKAESHA